MDRLLRLRPLWAVVTVLAVVWLALVPRDSALGSTVGYTVAWMGGAAFLLLMYKWSIVPTLSPVLRWIGVLGVYSYSLYIWHIAAARVTEDALARLVPGIVDHSVLVMLLRYAGAIAIAVIMTRLVEWPMLRVRNRVFPSSTRALPVPESPEARTLP